MTDEGGGWVLAAVTAQDPWTTFARGCAAAIRERFPQCRPLLDREATRASLDAAAPLEGLVFAGHGRDDALIGDDGGPLLDPMNAYLVSRGWVFALACSAGSALGPALRGEGALFVGYTFALGREPVAEEHLEALFAAVCAVVDALVHEGHAVKVRKPMLDVVDRFLDAHPELLDPLSLADHPDLVLAFEWLKDLSQLQVLRPLPP